MCVGVTLWGAMSETHILSVRNNDYSSQFWSLEVPDQAACLQGGLVGEGPLPVMPSDAILWRHPERSSVAQHHGLIQT